MRALLVLLMLVYSTTSNAQSGPETVEKVFSEHCPGNQPSKSCAFFFGAFIQKAAEQADVRGLPEQYNGCILKNFPSREDKSEKILALMREILPLVSTNAKEQNYADFILGYITKKYCSQSF